MNIKLRTNEGKPAYLASEYWMLASVCLASIGEEQAEAMLTVSDMAYHMKNLDSRHEAVALARMLAAAPGHAVVQHAMSARLEELAKAWKGKRPGKVGLPLLRHTFEPDEALALAVGALDILAFHGKGDRVRTLAAEARTAIASKCSVPMM